MICFNTSTSLSTGLLYRMISEVNFLRVKKQTKLKVAIFEILY